MKDIEIFYDKLSGRYFKYRRNSFKVIRNIINKKIESDGFIFVNDIYRLLGLTDTILGGRSGWKSDDDLSISLEEGVTYGDLKCVVINMNPDRIDERAR